MKLEYLEKVSPDSSIIRLYEFDSKEIAELISVIATRIIESSECIDLDLLPFVIPVNCRLRLHISDQDLGITKKLNGHFECNLSKDAYKEMLDLIVPFQKQNNGYQWLYDIYTEIEFLLSPSGKW